MLLVGRCSLDHAGSPSGGAFGKVEHGSGIQDDCQQARCRLALDFLSSTMSCCVNGLHVPLCFDDSISLCSVSVRWFRGAAAAATSLVITLVWSSELAGARPMRPITNCRALAVTVWCLHGSWAHGWLKPRLGEAVPCVCSTPAEPQPHEVAWRWHSEHTRPRSRIC